MQFCLTMASREGTQGQKQGVLAFFKLSFWVQVVVKWWSSGGQVANKW